MKLRLQPERKPRISSRDALVVDTTEPQSEFFDPRVDFPAKELARLKELAQEDDPKVIPLCDDQLNNGFWLSLVDPELKKLLLSHPKLKDVFKLEFDAFWKEWGGGGATPAWLLAMPGQSILLYPALKNEIRQGYLIHRLLVESRLPLVFVDKIKKLAVLLQLYPERRTEWLTNFDVHSDQVLQQLSLVKSGILKDKLEFIANLLLVFPDLRSAILADVNVRNIASQGKKELKSMSRPFARYDFNEGFFLTVIGAEDARIDETGQIQLQLKSRTALRAPHQLPDRPLA